MDGQDGGFNVASARHDSINRDQTPKKRPASKIASDDDDDGSQNSATSKRKKPRTGQRDNQNTIDAVHLDEARHGGTRKPLPNRKTNTGAMMTELNEEIKDALYGNIYDDDEDSEDINDSYIGATYWARDEKLRFFNALAI